MRTELPNLRAALSFCLNGGGTGAGLRLVGALYFFW